MRVKKAREEQKDKKKECKKCDQKSANTRGLLIRSLCKQIYDANEYDVEVE